MAAICDVIYLKIVAMETSYKRKKLIIYAKFHVNQTNYVESKGEGSNCSPPPLPSVLVTLFWFKVKGEQ